MILVAYDRHIKSWVILPEGETNLNCGRRVRLKAAALRLAKQMYPTLSVSIAPESFYYGN